MNKWDKRFLKLAKEVATYSKDPNTKVGCIISGKAEYFGFNGFPSKLKDDERLYDYKTKHALMIHAEMNALAKAGHDAQGAVLYCTRQPCVRCAVEIVSRGIAKVIAYKADKKRQQKYAEEYQLVSDIFVEAGIQYELLENPDEC